MSGARGMKMVIEPPDRSSYESPHPDMFLCLAADLTEDSLQWSEPKLPSSAGLKKPAGLIRLNSKEG